MIIRLLNNMEFPEANLDPSLLRTYEEEKAWLHNYTSQLRSIDEIPSIALPSSSEFYPNLLEGIIQKRSFIQRSDEFEARVAFLQAKLQEKDADILKIRAQQSTECILASAKNKALQEENVNIKIKYGSLLEKFESVQKELNEKEKEPELLKVNMLKNEIKAKDIVFAEEKGILMKKIADLVETNEKSNNIIVKLEGEISKLESSFQNRIESMKESIEKSYKHAEILQKSDYYYTKMKEYENLYIEAKSDQNKMLRTLEKNDVLENENSALKSKCLNLHEAYCKLRQDYEFIHAKLISITDLHHQASDNLEKEAKKCENLMKENKFLQAQVKSLTEQNSESIFTFTSVDDLLIKNTMMILKVDQLESQISSLTQENFELKKSLKTFIKPAVKQSSFIDEEIPKIEADFALTREQLLDRLTLKNSRLTAEVKYLEKRVNMLENSELKLKEIIDNLKNENIELNKSQTFPSIPESDESSKAMNIEILNNKIDTLENILEKSSERNKRLQDTLEAFGFSLVALEERNSTIHVENRKSQDSLLSEIFKLNQALAELEEKNQNLELSLKESQDSIVTKEQAFEIEMDILRKKNADYNLKIKEIEDENFLNTINLKNSYNELKKLYDSDKENSIAEITKLKKDIYIEKNSFDALHSQFEETKKMLFKFQNEKSTLEALLTESFKEHGNVAHEEEATKGNVIKQIDKLVVLLYKALRKE
ncbi:hypothetical protein SteCoe_33839 [Stentor coeruleus]|uniref:Uncharacterized protein n=1 Tax=Stentor coeruleus TaxID=5963 RepID=A0A1R2AVU4_9CILI|nr:hypothetical protein SteCoe_33839 [Stentor coeruleus]